MRKLPPGVKPEQVHGIGMTQIQHAIDEERAKPTQSDVRAAFKGKVVDHPDGTYHVDLKAPRDQRTWQEIKRPWNRTAHRILQEKNAKTERVMMRNRRGERVQVNADQHDHLVAEGFRDKGTHFGYSRAYSENFERAFGGKRG